jgi:hypothetical protein
MIGDREKEVLRELGHADDKLLRVWQMSVGADGDDRDQDVAALCLEAQLAIERIKNALKKKGSKKECDYQWTEADDSGQSRIIGCAAPDFESALVNHYTGEFQSYVDSETDPAECSFKQWLLESEGYTITQHREMEALEKE